MTADQDHELRFQLAASAVDTEAGVIRGATVAKAGVPALGKFVLLDTNGQITRDAEQAKKRIPVVTDSETLDTLLTAAAAAGGRVKVRSDHNDALSARAGYAENFRKDGDRVACDIHLFDAYKDRAIVLETADETPDEIGLSIDFCPQFEVGDDAAVMRVTELYAVDIVDAGAITPAGLFLSRGVDKAIKEELSESPNYHMAAKAPAEEAPDKIDQCLSAIAELAKGYTALSDKVDKLTPPAPVAKADDADEEMSATLKGITEKLDAQNKQLSAQADVIATMQKERAALGLKSNSDATTKLSAGSSDESAAQQHAPAKSYLDLVNEKKAEKLSASDAHRFVMQKHPEAYAAHIASKGITATKK